MISSQGSWMNSMGQAKLLTELRSLPFGVVDKCVGRNHRVSERRKFYPTITSAAIRVSALTIMLSFAKGLP